MPLVPMKAILDAAEKYNYAQGADLANAFMGGLGGRERLHGVHPCGANPGIPQFPVAGFLGKGGKRGKKFPTERIVDGNKISGEFFDYARPLMGDGLPDYALLRK